MRYLADLLTFTRIILSLVLLVLAFTNGSPEAAFLIFLIAELTDAFDGTCARKWPFPKNKAPKYRKYAAKYDMLSDGLLAAAQVLFCTLRVSLPIGLAVIVFYLAACAPIDLIVYGKIMGHPDDCTAGSLAKKNFPLAKKIILTRRYIYVSCLIIINLAILFATNWPLPVKIAMLATGLLIVIFLWFFLSQRRHNISRDAVEIEKKLSK